jgi:hypothetical protein
MPAHTFCGKRLWGRIASCGGFVTRPGLIENRPQVKNLPHIVICIGLSGALFAQQTVTPSPESPEQNTIGDYNITQSFEAGYRTLSVTGNDASYQSMVNYGDGLRLFDSDVEASSKDGHGWLFDQLSLKTAGLGNDPYESAVFRVEKNGWYEYDMNWRLSDYVNPGLTTVDGIDAANLQHRSQDHDLTLLPQSRVRFLLGYSRVTEDGPQLTTVSDSYFDATFNPGLLVPAVFQNIRRTQDEYRAGVDAKLWGFKLNILHDWEFFRDDTNVLQTSVLQSSPPTQLRSQPDHGETSGWRGFLERDFGGTLSVNARATYQGTGHGSLLDEQLFNPLTPGEAPQIIAVSGEASRPATAANLNIVWSPASKLSIKNEASYDQVQMNGNDTYSQFNTATLIDYSVNFQLLSIRSFSDVFDVSYQPRAWLGLDGGYEITTRRFASVVQSSDNSAPDPGAYSQNNILHAGTAGVRLRPMNRLTVNLSGEVGHTNRPIYPISDKDYHTFSGRAQYRAGSFSAGIFAKADYNVNSVSVSSFSSQSRSYGAETSWTPRQWLTFDATWSKLHLNTAGGLLYFANSTLISGTDSIYISNVQFGNVGTRLALTKHADLYLGYSRVQDFGDGRSTAEGSGTNTVAAFNVAQTYPLLYDTPLARLSVPLAARLRFNAGWQYYRYHEQFSAIRDYHANTAYTSLGWSF